jgi:hypothetical protein
MEILSKSFSHPPSYLGAACVLQATTPPPSEHQPDARGIGSFEAGAPHQNILQHLVSSAYTWDVFISHAGRDADKPFALQLWNLLDKPGIGLRVFLDERSLRHGGDAGAQMTEAMKSSRVGLLLLSQEFFDREFTRDELEVLFKRQALQRIVLLPVFMRMTTDQCEEALKVALPGGLHGLCFPTSGCMLPACKCVGSRLLLARSV